MFVNLNILSFGELLRKFVYSFQSRVIIRYAYPDGRNIITLTEPGMLAKIGLNNSGLGVCLNFMISSHELNGVPVHIVLRAILECTGIDDAREQIGRTGTGKSSHFLVGDDKGQCFGMEFAAGNCTEIGSQNGVLVHTNHCIGPGPGKLDDTDIGRETGAGQAAPGNTG